jgi:hypothetical protein
MEIACFHDIFKENAVCLAEALGLEIASDIGNKKYIVFGAHLKALELSQHPQHKQFLILQTENHASKAFNDKFYLRLLRSNYVLDYSPANRISLRELGVNILGYFPYLFKPYTSNYRPIDLGFVGSESPERLRIQDKLKAQYPNKRIEFVMDWSLLDQQKMTMFLLQCKQVLNISYYENNALETHRILKAQSCGCVVVNSSLEPIHCKPETTAFLAHVLEMLGWKNNE